MPAKKTTSRKKSSPAPSGYTRKAREEAKNRVTVDGVTMYIDSEGYMKYGSKARGMPNTWMGPDNFGEVANVRSRRAVSTRGAAGYTRASELRGQAAGKAARARAAAKRKPRNAR